MIGGAVAAGAKVGDGVVIGGCLLEICRGGDLWGGARRGRGALCRCVHRLL